MSINAAQSIPTLKEELNRKVFETLDWLLNGAKKGRMTEAQASFGMDVLFKAVSGLVDEDFINIITEAGDDELKHERRFFMNGDGDLLVVSWKPGTDRVVFSKRQQGYAIGGSVREAKSIQEAQTTFNGCHTLLGQKGWIEQ